MPLRERPFRLLFFAQATSLFGDFLVPVALAFAVLDLTGSASDLGLVLAARTVPMVVFALVGGVWADRLPQKHLMIASHLAQFGTQGLLGLSLVAGRAGIWQIVALQIAGGTARAFAIPASRGIVPQTVSVAGLQQANALLWAAFAIMGILGPAIAGVLIGTVGTGAALLGDAASFGVAAALLTLIHLPETARPERKSFLGDLAEGWREVASRRWLWGSIVTFSLFQLFVFSSITVLGPLVSKESLGGASAWAAIMTAFGIGSVLGNVAALHVRPQRPLVACFVLMFACVPSLFLLAVAAPLAVLVVSLGVYGVAVAFTNTIWETTVQRHVPRNVLSRVVAYDWVGSAALRPLGLALMGPFAALTSARAALVTAGLILLAINGAVLSIADVRNLVDPPERNTVPAAAEEAVQV
jgi:predicted MFS family arabinose efflux permease